MSANKNDQQSEVSTEFFTKVPKNSNPPDPKKVKETAAENTKKK